MNTGRYTLKEFLTDHNLDQIIIPEIQRDYVWQEDNVINLLKSILENSIRQNEISSDFSEEQLNNMPPDFRKIIERELEKKKNYCNVGFIYAYFDIELSGRFMLIDGQQRMTTLFLILLSLSVKENKQDQFKRLYFKDSVLKFDYKVRESAHDFMLNFFEHILSGKDHNTVIDQYWYFSDYGQDITIQSIIKNYKIIDDFVKIKDLSLQYIENYIEFWYFDTKESKQGEELYIYMNSRGESVNSSDNIKAELLKGLSDHDKHDWGLKWEKWQNLFWKYKKENTNADKGFEEFLKLVKIIELTKASSQKSLINQENNIRKIKESPRISVEGLTLQIIENYFDAFTRLINFNIYNKIWLTGNFNAISYLILLPAIMYAEKYQDCRKEIIFKFVRFFNNTSRFESLKKAPYSSTSIAIGLTKQFLDANYSDVADLIEFQEKKSYENILTIEEVSKLSIYKQSDPDLRNKIERAFWAAQDFKFCKGRIEFIWHCINYEPSKQIFNEQKLDEFNFCFSNFKTLFESPNDLVRRALLTKGDYKVHDGWTATFEGNRYSFIYEDVRWEKEFSNKVRFDSYKLLINDFGQIKNQNINMTKDDILNQIIKTFLTKTLEKNWAYYFVKEPKILEYCKQKLVCFKTNDLNNIILLKDRKAASFNWERLNEFVEFEK